MDAQPTSLITRMFDNIEAADDPRVANARHLLTDILVIAILSVMSGCQSGEKFASLIRNHWSTENGQQGV